MNKNPLIQGSADDFSWRMRRNRNLFDVEIGSITAQIKILWTQGIITENTMNVILDKMTELVARFVSTETDYYEMRNILEEKEEKNEDN